MSDLDLHEPTRLTYPYRNEALGRIEAKVDALVSVVEMGEAKAPPTPPISQLARDIGEDKLALPSAVRIERAVDDVGEYATALTYGALTLTIDEAVSLGVLQAGLPPLK
jgi:hypothetical protein